MTRLVLSFVVCSLVYLSLTLAQEEFPRRLPAGFTSQPRPGHIACAGEAVLPQSADVPHYIRIATKSFDFESDTSSVIFGYACSVATRSLDTALGEYELPPPAFCGGWDVRLIAPGDDSASSFSTPIDFRPPVVVDTFILALNGADIIQDRILLKWQYIGGWYGDSLILVITRSTDSGGTIRPEQRLNMQLTDSVIVDSPQAYSIHRIYFLYYEGAFPCGDLGVNEQERGYPLSTALEAVYPNPFNPTTTIRYRLSQAGVVRLGVTDVLGREVAVLVNEFQQPGEHSVSWNAAGNSSGVYFCKLEMGRIVRTGKVLYIR